MTGGSEVRLLLADLSSQADSAAPPPNFSPHGRPLHVLINNAGVVNLKHTLTGDGIADRLRVQTTRVFLLTSLLLDR